jgi:hypothetical protein
VLVGDGGRMHTDGPAGADEIHTLYGICWKIPRVVSMAIPSSVRGRICEAA